LINQNSGKAIAGRIPQKIKGMLWLIKVKLAPRGGARKEPTMPIAEARPIAVPPYVAPTPLVLNNNVLRSGIAALRKKPLTKSRTYTRLPWTNGSNSMLTDIIDTEKISIPFCEPSLLARSTIGMIPSRQAPLRTVIALSAPTVLQPILRRYSGR